MVDEIKKLSGVPSQMALVTFKMPQLLVNPNHHLGNWDVNIWILRKCKRSVHSRNPRKIIKGELRIKNAKRKAKKMFFNGEGELALHFHIAYS